MSSAFQRMYETSIALQDLGLRLNQVTNGVRPDLSQEPKSLHPMDEEALQSIDAAMFSGDAFYNEHAAARLEYFMGRWARGLVTIRAEQEEEARRVLAARGMGEFEKMVNDTIDFSGNVAYELKAPKLPEDLPVDFVVDGKGKLKNVPGKPPHFDK